MCDTIEYTETDNNRKLIFLNLYNRNKFIFPALKAGLLYKNYGLYLTRDEQTAYIYPENYLELEKQGLVDTLKIVND